MKSAGSNYFLIYTFYRNVSEFLTEEQTSDSFPFENIKNICNQELLTILLEGLSHRYQGFSLGKEQRRSIGFIFEQRLVRYRHFSKSNSYFLRPLIERDAKGVGARAPQGFHYRTPVVVLSLTFREIQILLFVGNIFEISSFLLQIN